MSAPQVQVHPDEDSLARAIAAQLADRLAAAIAARGSASVVLTGGGIGTRLLAELAQAPPRDLVDWARLDVWWGDERFVPSGDPERNEAGARDALLDHVPVHPGRVHPMDPSDGPDGDNPEAAAAQYAAELEADAEGGLVPSFDVLLLGIGPEGHVASGPEKAEAVARALADSDPAQVPAAGARGRELTLFLIDEAAAAKLPAESGPG
jgi:6-phosphogluconolactonase